MHYNSWACREPFKAGSTAGSTADSTIIPGEFHTLYLQREGLTPAPAQNTMSPSQGCGRPEPIQFCYTFQEARYGNAIPGDRSETQSNGDGPHRHTGEGRGGGDQFYTEVLGLAPHRVEEYRAGKVPFPCARINEGTIIDLSTDSRPGARRRRTPEPGPLLPQHRAHGHGRRWGSTFAGRGSPLSATPRPSGLELVGWPPPYTSRTGKATPSSCVTIKENVSHTNPGQLPV